MNIDVTQTTPNSVVVIQPVESVSVTQSISTVTARAYTVQPELAGFFLERVGEDGWTIWFEDGN